MADLQPVTTKSLITSVRQNLINDYIENGTHRVNTLALFIGGTETISSSKQWLGNLIITGTVSASNLSGTNTGDQDLSGLEPKLPDTPENPTTKYLNGLRQWVPIAIGAGGFAANLYFTTINSDVSGYKKISYIVEGTETELSGTITNQEVLFRTYLYDLPIDIDTIDAGVWIANYRVKVSGTQGETQLKFEAFVRHSDNTETTLFSDYSPVLNNTEYATIRSESNQPAFDISSTDRLGIRIYAKTTAANAITINTIVGDGNGSYFTTPLRIRHNQLRGLNEDENYQHIDVADRTNLDNLSGTNSGDQVGDGVTITGAGTIEDPFVASVPTASVNGGVFITNIIPQSTGNVSEKIFSSDGYVLDSCLTSTNLVTLSVMAISGNTNYIPVVKINDEPVTLVGDNTTPLFTGTINIDLNDTESITVVHEDGAEHTVSIDYEDTPVISSVEFIGDYPGSQTELKAGDTFSLRVQSTTNFTQIYVYDYGACVEQTETFTATNDKTITITIADRGTTAQELTGKVKIINSNGTSSADSETSNTLNLNNLYPTVNITTITYPASQGALKDSETATVENGLSNYNSVVYSSGNSQLSITNPTTYESPKTVTRIAGDYNIDTNNLTITATRTANNAVTASSTIIKIAHTSPTIAITLPQARLRSGGNDGTDAQNYVVTLTATQELLQAPTLDLGAEGTWVGAGFAGSGTTWTRNILIDDDDIKGSYDFNNLSCYNLAGTEVTTITSGATYTLGGFVSRTITLPAFANEATMNVAAVTYSKVSMTWSVKSLTNKRAVGTTTVPDPNSWCLHSLETNPTIIRILDLEACNASSQVSTITIQETV